MSARERMRAGHRCRHHGARQGYAHHPAAAQALRVMVRDEVPLLLSLVNYAETLIRPAEDERALRTAVGAIGIELVAPTPAIARDAARTRGLGVSLADAFALAHSRRPASSSRRP